VIVDDEDSLGHRFTLAGPVSAALILAVSTRGRADDGWRTKDARAELRRLPAIGSRNRHGADSASALGVEVNPGASIRVSEDGA